MQAKADRQVVKQQVLQSARGYFRPEFLNRLDDIVVFDPLSNVSVARDQGLPTFKPSLWAVPDAIVGPRGDRRGNIANPERGMCFVLMHWWGYLASTNGPNGSHMALVQSTCLSSAWSLLMLCSPPARARGGSIVMFFIKMLYCMYMHVLYCTCMYSAVKCP